MPWNLIYNSKNWRNDANNDSSHSTWLLGADVGYGFGWKLQAGLLTPVYRDIVDVDHYVFADSTGAEYRLDQQVTIGNIPVWTTSGDSVYLWYDPNLQRLHFNDGSFWVMNCTSAGTEQDAGTSYPTTMQDSNGNQIGIAYKAAVGVTWANSSARIDYTGRALWAVHMSIQRGLDSAPDLDFEHSGDG